MLKYKAGALFTLYILAVEVTALCVASCGKNRWRPHRGAYSAPPDLRAGFRGRNPWKWLGTKGTGERRERKKGT